MVVVVVMMMMMMISSQGDVELYSGSDRNDGFPLKRSTLTLSLGCEKHCLYQAMRRDGGHCDCAQREAGYKVWYESDRYE